MKWQIPAKTFLLGEYAALAGAPAILVTTSPLFEVELIPGNERVGIHPDSPAGLWWSHVNLSQGLSWHDPYAGRGGVGASSAQFLGAYLASCYVSHTEPDHQSLLNAYYQCAWQGEGLRPSGYDLLAQSQQKCVYINRQQEIMTCYDWAFDDISFLLLHSGQKLATHHHLQTMKLPPSIKQLSAIVEGANQAFVEKDSEGIINAINAYQDELARLNLTAEHTLRQITQLKLNSKILAAKGCGAMGADVLLLIIPAPELKSQAKKFAKEGWTILASSNSLYSGLELIKNNRNCSYPYAAARQMGMREFFSQTY
jgi:mevalonate kinase